MQLADGFTGLNVNGHGGSCCGIKHIHEFPTGGLPNQWSLEQRLGWINKAVVEAVEHCGSYDDEFDSESAWHVACEVVLIDEQLPHWEEALKQVGFKEVFSFLNDNSGNICHVFYLENGA
jgi:hypothetical protein